MFVKHKLGQASYLTGACITTMAEANLEAKSECYLDNSKIYPHPLVNYLQR